MSPARTPRLLGASALGTPLAVLLASLLALLLGPAPRAEACSCVGRSPAEYVAGADLVFFARAGKERAVRGRGIQPLEVLHALKGRPGKVFALSRPKGALSTCDRTFRAGEVALVFITKGGASVCDGNYDLKAVHLAQLAELLKAGRPAPSPPDLAALRAALGTALGAYLHERPRVPVTWAPLAGRVAQVGKTTLDFVANRLKHAVELRQALRAGPLTFVEGFYGLEGFAFRVLLREAGRGSFETLALWGAERKR